MAGGFSVTESILASPAEVWANLTDFENASRWMPGVGDFTPVEDKPLETGAVLTFTARGKARESRITAYEPDRRLALTSTQGGVTATYEYTLSPAGNGTDIKLNAVCEASGLWKLMHPLIVLAMKKTDSPQLKNLKTMIEAGSASH